MTKDKQLILYAILLGAYSSSSICMYKHEQEAENQKQSKQRFIEQKFDFDALPLNVQEQIINYLPANNLYRALWSRCHNGSQNCCDDTTKAYLESHFVPQEFIDKTIAQDFAHFHGSEKEKQEFQEKIKRALQHYGQNDTELLARYKQNVNARMLSSLDLYPASLKLTDLIKSTEEKNECTARVRKIKEDGELAQVKKQLQKLNSFIKCYRAWLPLTQNKAQFIRLLHTLVNKYAGSPAVLAITILTNYLLLTLCRPLKYLDEQTGEKFINLLNSSLFFVYCISVNSLTTSCVMYTRNRLNSSFDYYLLAYANVLEELQAKVLRALDTIDQLEKA